MLVCIGEYDIPTACKKGVFCVCVCVLQHTCVASCCQADEQRVTAMQATVNMSLLLVWLLGLKSGPVCCEMTQRSLKIWCAAGGAGADSTAGCQGSCSSALPPGQATQSGQGEAEAAVCPGVATAADTSGKVGTVPSCAAAAAQPGPGEGRSLCLPLCYC